MANIDDVESGKKIRKGKHRPFIVPDECLPFTKIVEKKRGYRILSIQPWLKTKDNKLFVEKYNPKNLIYGVFPEKGLVCIAGFFHSIGGARAVVDNQSHTDTCLTLVKEAKELEEEGLIPAAEKIADAAYGEQKGHPEALETLTRLESKLKIFEAHELARIARAAAKAARGEVVDRAEQARNDQAKADLESRAADKAAKDADLAEKSKELLAEHSNG